MKNEMEQISELNDKIDSLKQSLKGCNGLPGFFIKRTRELKETEKELQELNDKREKDFFEHMDKRHEI